MDILGIDEAGRGSVLGPMVIAGVIVPEKMEKVLERMGVKDSKRLTPNRRTILSRKLKKMFDYEIVVISAREIDEMRADGINLNEIEKNAMESILLKLKPEKAIVDAVDVKAERFQENLCKDTGLNVIAEHKADDKYIEVSAASIIAKAERDDQIKEINKDFIKSGGIGSGYPSDPTTKKFLANYVMRRGMYTGCVRDSHLHRVFRGVIGPDFCFISITKCSNAHEPVHFSILRYFLNKVNKKQQLFS